MGKILFSKAIEAELKAEFLRAPRSPNPKYKNTETQGEESARLPASAGPTTSRGRRGGRRSESMEIETQRRTPSEDREELTEQNGGLPGQEGTSEEKITEKSVLPR